MSLRHMDANHNIEDEKWAGLAKWIYDPESPTLGEESSMAKGADSPDAREKEQLLLMAKKVDLYFELEKYSTAEAWEKVQQQIQDSSQRPVTLVRRLMLKPWMKMAAAVLVIGMLSFGGYQIVSQWGTSRQIVEVSASNQATRTVTLPDGTVISLNSNTELTYPKSFAQNTREVTLKGEAFFEVKPDKNKPFIIHAGNAQVKVLGTSFNVNAYPAEQLMEVIVKTGKVQVINKSSQAQVSDELILNPGERGTLVYASHSLLKTTNENPNFLSWKTHELIFKATSLEEVISNLEKVYKVKIRVDDPALNKLLLTAHFNNYSLDFILKVIETTFQIETRQIDEQYILKAKS